MLNDIIDKITKLRALGKNESEMDFWESVAPVLTQAEQLELLQTLNAELAVLDKSTA